jgi:cytochrome c5
MNTLTTAMAAFGIALVLVTQTLDLGPTSHEAVPPSVATINVSGDHVGADIRSEDLTDLVQQYCQVCHNDVMMTGNLSLTGFDVAAAPAMAETAERMIRKLRAGMMPPRGMPRPGGDSLQVLVETMEASLDAAAAANPNPGSRPFQRLNQAEYKSAVRDLLGLEIDVGSFLPLDTKSANFDNIADVQMPSTTLMEGYLRAASHVSRIALGDPDAESNSTRYRISKTASQKDRVEGAPFGTRGGLSVIHNFPTDGKYVFHIQPQPAVEGEVFGRTFGNEQIEVSIDGERVALMTVDRWMSESEPTGLNMLTDSIYVRAGPRRVTAAFLLRFEGEVDDLIRPIDHTLADGQIGIGYGVTTLPHLQRLSILGPYEVTGVSETPTRQSVFTCRPTSPEEARPCAEIIVSRLASRAYRRPLEESDVRGLMTFYDTGAGEGGFEGGVRNALQAILASPHFLFRIEEVPAQAAVGEVHRIRDMDLASRLSFFLWGSPPDQELIDIAGRGQLSGPGEMERQARRMLADPRAPEALATRFWAQWLHLQDLDKIHPDALSYPYFDETLAKSMRRETELLFTNLVEEDGNIVELLTADYTFVDERLARHYGMPGVTGSTFRRVSYMDENRRGILGHGSILTMTSHANRTSPVLRGKWVLEVLLDTPPPPPPPDVPAFEETDGAEDGRFFTVRERMEQHRANPVCMACHVVIDPIGLSLENFDVTGAWRIRDEGNFVDPVGQLYDGTPLTGPADLRAALLSRPEVYYRVFTKNLMAYALGRRVEYYDMPTIRAITREAADNDYRVSSFIMGVVASPAFQMFRVQDMVSTEPAEGAGR